MKKAVVTIASGEYFERMAALTHPTLRAYAQRIGADFLVWNDIRGYTIPEYKKLEIGALLEHYDRVLYVDTDIIIRDDAPDIFAVVPEDHMGMLEESRYYDRRIGTLRFMEHVGFDSTKWNGKYYNAGMFVCSKCHRDVFVRPPVEWDHFRDQTWFNTLVADRGVKVFSLPYRFNRILGLDRVYGESRLDAWFLHYAGVSVVQSREETLELIAHDLEAWRQARPEYRFASNILFVLEGGLGKQVCAEPVLRYARDAIYRGDNLAIITPWPELYSHLGLPTFERVEQVPSLGKYHQRRLVPADDESMTMLPNQVHGTTWAALWLLGLELPVSERTPRLPVRAGALSSVQEKLGLSIDVSKLVVIHPGTGAAPDTLPADAWRAYLDALLQAGLRVAVIGERTDHRRGIVEFDRGGCIDLVDQLSVAELIALLSRARALISNDSGPLQIAGAFEGHIGLIPGLRHPDYVLPWRRGSQAWRTAVLSRGTLWSDYFQTPSGSRQPDTDQCDPSRLRDCLPTPEQVVDFVRRAVTSSDERS